MAGNVSVLRTPDGEVKWLEGGRCIFTRDCVYFTLDRDQMLQISTLIEGLLNSSLITIDPESEDMHLAD